MKLTKIVLIIAAASFAAGSAVAQQSIGEPSYLGGKRRYVPAPAPVPETFNWYVRADLGVGITSTNIGESGLLGNGPGADFWAAANQPVRWFDGNSDVFVQGGIGFGKYFSPRFRMDATLDFKTADEFGRNGTQTYVEVVPPAGPGLPPGPGLTGNTVLVTGTEQVEVIDGVGLINAYLDLVPRGRFTPYIGIGAGFAVRSIDRSHTSTEVQLDGGGVPTGATRTWSGDDKETKFAPAVSATAGLAWAITPGTIFDINYRYTYIGSVDASMTIATAGATQRSKITIDESHQHAIRAGLRWNIW